MAGFSEQLQEALDLLPSYDKPESFDDFKARLYAKNPNGGRDVFAHMIKNDMLRKELVRDSAQNVQLVVSKLEVK